MKRCFLLSTILMLFVGAFAQSISVKSFQALPMDMTASSIEGKKIDQNGDVAALIKVVTNETGFVFEGGTLGIVDVQQRISEIWVWVPRGLRKITIMHPQFGQLRDYRFPVNIEAERTYELMLVTSTNTTENIVKEDAQVQVVVFEVTPRNATLEVNDQVWKLDDNGSVMKMVELGTYTYRVQAEGFYPDAGKITVNDPNNPYKTTIKLLSKGAIAGEYSVNASKKVYFSKGNLQYQASTNTWRFAEHQWDYVGDANKNISPTYTGWVDMFGWGTGNNPTKIDGLFNHSIYSTFADWGLNKIQGEVGQWHTLTAEEWNYVFSIRFVESGIRFAKAVVNGINGVILLPDHWSKDYYMLKSPNDNKAPFESNIISDSDWTSSLESHGAVFLPAAGYRAGRQVGNIGEKGIYWSATPIPQEWANYVLFQKKDLDPKHSQYGRGCGLSVRLVREIK